MDIENYRALLSALISALPMVMSLGLLAILAYPTSKTGLKNEEMYKKFTRFLIPILCLFMVAIFLDISSLSVLCANGNNPLLSIALFFSITSLIVMPIYLFIYIRMIPKLWK